MKVLPSVARFAQMLVLCASASVLLAFGGDERTDGSAIADEKADGSSKSSDTATPIRPLESKKPSRMWQSVN